jgi:4-aminobutyrate aminotransferase
MGERQQSLAERHRAVMPGWLATYYDEPVALERGEGCRVWDVEGNEYLDFFGGILSTISGHNVPDVVDAIREQAGKILHTSTVYLIESQVELAERILELTPMPDAKVFFTTSGTEAIDAALMVCTTYRRSNQVLALRNSYHGRSFSAVSVTGNRGWSPNALSPLWVSYVHGGYRFRSPFGHLPDDEYIAACTDDLRNVIETTTAGDVACLIAEPVQGVGGFIVPPDGLLKAFKEILDEYEIPFVCDEVQTGWGRTGEHFWGFQAHGVTPDVMVFAKGVGNGLSIGGIVARAEIMDSLGANSISTFGGNPLSTAGALANINYLIDHDLQGNCRKVGEHLMRRLQELAQDKAVIGEVRGKGLMIGIEFVEPGTKTPDAGAAAALMQETKNGGLLLGKSGLYQNVVRMAPPLSVTIEEADRAFEILSRSFDVMEIK